MNTISVKFYKKISIPRIFGIIFKLFNNKNKYLQFNKLIFP